MLNRIYFVLLLAAGIILAGCSSSKEVQSSFSNDIKVDGDYSDWGTNLVPIKDENIAVGFVNNDNYLYMSIVTSDRNKIRKIIGSGLTIWLESSDGKIGIRYPLKLDQQQMMQMRMMQIGNDPQTADRNIMNLLKGREDLQVISKDEMPLYTERADVGESFRAKINSDRDQLVYEIQIPLKNDITSRVFGKSIKEAEVTLQTNQMNREGMRPDGMGRGEGPEGMEPPEGMDRPGGMRQGGMRPGGMERDFKPLEYSFKVKLQLNK